MQEKQSKPHEGFELAELLLLAEEVTGISAKTLSRLPRLAGAESALAAPHASFGGVALYPDPIDRAAILCSRLVRNHPFPDGNKRVAFLAMLLHLDRNGFALSHPGDDQAQTAATIERLAAGELAEASFVEWVHDHARPKW